MDELDPRYLGDGVYAYHDGYQIWLKTEREMGRVERIALEPDVLQSLIRYDHDLRQKYKSET